MSLALVGVALAMLAAGPGHVYVSPDRTLPGHRRRRQHAILHAAWTPDAQFFVISTEATGGHQPWARPIWIYARSTNKFFDLSALGVVAVRVSLQQLLKTQSKKTAYPGRGRSRTTMTCPTG